MGCSGSKSTREAETTETIKPVNLDSSVASRPTPAETQTPASTSQMDASTDSQDPPRVIGEGENENVNAGEMNANDETTTSPPNDDNANNDDDNRDTKKVPMCVYCCEEFTCPEDEIPRPCLCCHTMVCGDCVRKQFTMACKDSLSMPPRCCNMPFNLIRGIRFMDADEITLYKEKFEEWRTMSPVYCPATECAAFIPYRLFPLEKRVSQKKKPRPDVEMMVFEEAMVFYGQMVRELVPSEGPSEWGLERAKSSPDLVTVECPKCATQVCCDCKGVAHPATPCKNSVLDIDPDLEAVLKTLKIKRCPKCHSGVRKMFGCSHILCRCGCQWCWQCNQDIVTCDETGCVDYESEDDEEEYEEDDGADPDDAYLLDSTPAWDNEDEGSDDEEDENDRIPGDSTPGDAVDTPNTSVVADSQPDTTSTSPNESQEAQQDVPQPEPMPKRARDLDAGGRSRWDGDEYNFGMEGDRGRRDPWDCSHVWSLEVVRNNYRNYDNGERLCENCWEEVGWLDWVFPEVAKLMETGELWEDEDGEKHPPDDGYYSCLRCHYVLCRGCRREFGRTI